MRTEQQIRELKKYYDEEGNKIAKLLATDIPDDVLKSLSDSMMMYRHKSEALSLALN